MANMSSEMTALTPTSRASGAQSPLLMSMVATPDELHEEDYTPYTPLPDIYYDVTDTFASTVACITFPCNGYPKTSLLLQDQEVMLRMSSLLVSSKQRRPYAQLGSVDKRKTPCGQVFITSNLTPPTPESQKNGQIPGFAPGWCGCNSEMADSIVANLQERKTLRGGIGQIKKLDYVLSKTARIGTIAPMLADALGIRQAPQWQPTHLREKLPVTEIDISQCMDPLCCTSRKLILGEEEAEMHISQCGRVSTYNTKREYGELGFVERKKHCICCYSVDSDISQLPGRGQMTPGCPCTNRSKVSRIVQELRDRMSARGQVGQIRKQDKILGMVAGIDENLRLISNKLGVEFPPNQEDMQRRYGSNPPTFSEPLAKQTALETKTYDTTSKVDSYMTCIATCGMAGMTKETVQLDADYMFVTSKSNIDDSQIKIPYAEMDSVDIKKSCCCFWEVNDQSPGWGCSSELVSEMAANLQERKEKRGNIAQLKQLRAMQSTVIGLNLMADMALEKEGITIPVTAEGRAQVWGGKLPRGLLSPTETPHLEPPQEFATKVYDVTNIPASLITLGCTCCTAGWQKRTLELDAEEMTLITQDNCAHFQSRTPYGNLGSVETEQACCCTILPDVAIPGCGCSGDLVQEIAEQLQERKVKKGNIAQMKQQENIIIELLKLEPKMDLLAHKKNIQYPPIPEVMARVFK